MLSTRRNSRNRKVSAPKNFNLTEKVVVSAGSPKNFILTEDEVEERLCLNERFSVETGGRGHCLYSSWVYLQKIYEGDQLPSLDMMPCLVEELRIHVAKFLRKQEAFLAGMQAPGKTFTQECNEVEATNKWG